MVVFFALCKEETMYLMIDNYDSFVYNLACYLEECGEKVLLIRNDKITLSEIERLLADEYLEGLIISPGPKSPKDCGNCKEILEKTAGKVPVLGVCLGHQIIGEVFRHPCRKVQNPCTEKKLQKYAQSDRTFWKVFLKIYSVTRYHFPYCFRYDFPGCLKIDALSEGDLVWRCIIKPFPIYGVQFHPEAVLTKYGHELLKNFTKYVRNGEKIMATKVKNWIYKNPKTSLKNIKTKIWQF